jgi:hypothetical protein
MCRQTLTKFQILGLANEADGDQRGLLQFVGAARDILDEDLHQIRPFIPGQLDSGDGDDELGGGLTGPPVCGLECVEGKLLDLRLDFWGNLLEPFSLNFV